jgi:glycosyltransferase involved in cell wall biosynthesis
MADGDAMHLLMINYEYPPIGAGAAKATRSMARCLVKKGHGVTVLTSAFDDLRGQSREEGVEVLRIPSLRKRAAQSNMAEMCCFLISGFLCLPGLMRGRKIDGTIVFFSFPCGPLGLWGRVLKKIPYVVSLRGGDVPGNEASLNSIHRLLTPLRRLIFRHALSVVANSEGLQQLSEKADPCPVMVIPNGIDPHLFHPSTGKRRKKNRLLFVGRFQAQKNLLFLLNQVELAYQQTGADFQLDFVGDGPLKDELVKLSRTLACRDKIYFHGWCDSSRLRAFYQEAHFLINPSFCEGMSNVVLEAMACGCPVIASNVPGHQEIVQHGKTGFLFDLGKPEQFQELLAGILSGYFNVPFENDIASFETRFYSWEETSGRYLDIFQRAID